VRRWSFIQRWWGEASWAERLYVGGVWLFLFSLFWAFLSIQYAWPEETIYIVVLVPFLCFAVGFSYEVFSFAHRLWRKGIGKIVATLAGFAAGGILWLARVLSAQLINSFIPIDPSHFAFSLQLFTVFLALLIWTGILALIVSVVYFLTVVYLMFEISKPYFLLLISMLALVFVLTFYVALLYVSVVVLIIVYVLHKYNKIYPATIENVGKKLSYLFDWLGNSFEKWGRGNEGTSFQNFVNAFARVLGAAIVLSLIMGLLTMPAANADRLLAVSSSIIALVDHYPNSICANYTPSQGERVAFIGEGKVSVAIPRVENGYRFEIRNCNLTASNPASSGRGYAPGRPARQNSEKSSPSVVLDGTPRR